MREIFTSGSVGGAPGNRCFYPDLSSNLKQPRPPDSTAPKFEISHLSKRGCISTIDSRSYNFLTGCRTWKLGPRIVCAARSESGQGGKCLWVVAENLADSYNFLTTYEKRGYGLFRNPLFLLVGMRGFEPPAP